MYSLLLLIGAFITLAVSASGVNFLEKEGKLMDKKVDDPFRHMSKYTQSLITTYPYIIHQDESQETYTPQDTSTYYSYNICRASCYN